MDSNKTVGSQFESEFCEILSRRGFWVYNTPNKRSGQPADIIAVRNGKPFLIDCKVCSGNTFSLARIEPNQDTAMQLWNRCGNGAGWFAVKCGGSVYMIAYDILAEMRRAGKTRTTRSNIEFFGIPLERWML